MRAVIQRVRSATVTVNEKTLGEIGGGLLVLLGVEASDTEEDLLWLCGKIARLRIFDDEHGVMNLSVKEASGRILLVSQFTLLASTRKGNRPNYSRAAPPEMAKALYAKAIETLASELGDPIQTGEFGAEMLVQLVNWGPVTIILDSKARE
jgi:D-tyrosyl-tRNA(Tyr) deacylase